MAITYITEERGATNTTTSFSITLPTTQANDILILEFTHRGTGDGTISGTSVTTDGLTWNLKHSQLYNAFSGKTYWTRATGNHYGRTVTGASLTNSCAAIMTVYRGAVPVGDPLSDATIVGEENASGDKTQAQITTATNNSWVVLVVANSPDRLVSSQACTSPTLVARAERLSTGGTDTSIAHASGEKVTAGGTGAFTWSQSNLLNGSWAYAIKNAIPTTYDQNSYRWRNDDGSESAATWGAAINTALPVTVIGNIQKRLRFLVQNVGASDTGFAPQLEVGIAPEWTQQTSGFGTSYISGVTHNGTDQYVVVGNSGKLRTSSDGVTWTQRTSSFGSSYISYVTYNGTDQYVAVGNSGKLATSPDGEVWTSQTSGFGTSSIFGVTHNGTDQYVAVGQDGKLATSSDGVTWTQQTSSFGTTLINAVTYNGSNQYVAVSNSGKIATSSNGTSWTQQTSSFGTSDIRAVTYNGTDQYVAVGNLGKLATSPDGETWTQQTSNFGTSDIHGVTHNGTDQYVAVGEDGKLATSSDGEVWTQQTSSFDTSNINAVNYGIGQYVAVGQDGKLATLNGDYIYHDVTTVSTLAKAFDSVNLTNAADTTQQIGVGTFIVDNNGISEDGLAGATTSAGYDEAEYEFTVEFVAVDLIGIDNLRFRIKAS